MACPVSANSEIDPTKIGKSGRELAEIGVFLFVTGFKSCRLGTRPITVENEILVYCCTLNKIVNGSSVMVIGELSINLSP